MEIRTLGDACQPQSGALVDLVDAAHTHSPSAVSSILIVP